MRAPIKRFWWYWLLLVTAGVMLFGLSLVLLPRITQQFFNWLIFTSRPNPMTSPEAVHYITFVYGVLGAVMVGWSVGLFSFLTNGFQRGERYAWNAVTLSVTTWFVIDSAFSLSMGFIENVLLNVVFFVLFAIPLAATYRDFYPRQPLNAGQSGELTVQ